MAKLDMSNRSGPLKKQSFEKFSISLYSFIASRKIIYSPVDFGLDGQQIEQEQEFRYLGSLISDDGYCYKEIASRIGIAKKVFQESDKRKLFTGKINLELKKRIVKCLVWSVATYAAETWTLR